MARYLTSTQKASSASPKVWTDAFLAAFAIGHAVEFVTLDSDFKRFVKAGLKLQLLTS